MFSCTNITTKKLACSPTWLGNLLTWLSGNKTELGQNEMKEGLFLRADEGVGEVEEGHQPESLCGIILKKMTLSMVSLL